MSDKDPTVGALIGLVFGVGLFFSGFKKWGKRRAVARTPTSKVRSAALGLCEFFGRAKPASGTLLSPISETACLYYYYEIEEYRKSGKSSKWVRIQSGKSAEPFFVEDMTGRIMVLPSGATLVAHEDQQFKLHTFMSGDEAFRAALYRLGVPVLENNLRAHEIYILEDDPIYVLGDVKRNGIGSEVNQENLVVTYSKDSFFIISDRSEKELLSHLGWRTLFKIVGGPIIAIICLLILLTRFNVINI